MDGLVADYWSCLDKQADRVETGESWFYCRATENFELISIERMVDSVAYGEAFGLLDGELVYAIEWSLIVVDGETTGPWNATYIIEDEQIVHHESLGHGETEQDGWEPESIFPQWEARVAGYLSLRTEA